MHAGACAELRKECGDASTCHIDGLVALRSTCSSLCGSSGSSGSSLRGEDDGAEECEGGEVDEGQLEAAIEQAQAQAVMSVLNQPWMLKGWGVEAGQVAFTPVTPEEYAASFNFGFGAAAAMD